MDLFFVSLWLRMMPPADLFSVASDFRSPKERTASGYESDAIPDIGQLRRWPGGPVWGVEAHPAKPPSFPLQPRRQ